MIRIDRFAIDTLAINVGIGHTLVIFSEQIEYHYYRI
jgi:hypothetical protein